MKIGMVWIISPDVGRAWLKSRERPEANER